MLYFGYYGEILKHEQANSHQKLMNILNSVSDGHSPWFIRNNNGSKHNVPTSFFLENSIVHDIIFGWQIEVKQNQYKF